MSLTMLILSIINSSCVTTLFYHTAEGVITFLFALEIALRLTVMRGNFWESSLNIIEAVVCGVCVTIFLILHYTRQVSSLMEHQILILLRYVGQTLRVVGLYAADSTATPSIESGLRLYDISDPRSPPDEQVDNLCDIL
ncbi:hypothetical protein TRVL_03816 [Trypanosoma vivax]|nr:hypothetical protein TRVL_03816 [Trypanosoma vivax]